jgi:hypothetical protein
MITTEEIESLGFDETRDLISKNRDKLSAQQKEILEIMGIF